MSKNFKLSAKLLGFSVLLFVVVLIIALNSVASIRRLLSANQQFSNAAEHKIRVIEKEAEHSKWVQKIQDMFNMNGATLDIQLDHTQCGLGRFLDGEEGWRLGQSDANLATLLNDIKQPHKDLHESAKLIKEVWKQRHIGLSAVLKDLLDDHKRWAANVSEAATEINVETDPNLSAMGKFLAGEHYAQYAKDFALLKEVMDAIREPHKQMYKSAGEIQRLIKAGDYDKAMKEYQSVTVSKISEIDKALSKLIEAEGALEMAQEKAQYLFKSQTFPASLSIHAKINPTS